MKDLGTSKPEENIDETRKYKEIYDFSMKLYESQIDRFQLANEQVFKYFTNSSFIALLLFFVTDHILNKTVPWFVFTLYLIATLFYIASLLMLSVVLMQEKVVRVDLTVYLLKTLEENRLEDIYLSMSYKFKEAFQENVKKTDAKSKILGYSYRGIIISIVLLMIDLVFLSLK